MIINVLIHIAYKCCLNPHLNPFLKKFSLNNIALCRQKDYVCTCFWPFLKTK
jgi:hypothetical protein